MKKDKNTLSSIFWITVVTTFAMLVHNGTEPIFLLAYATLPFIILAFIAKPTLRALVIYLLIFGALGRYTRYFRQTYASDALLAIKDYIGYFLAGKNVYKEIVMAQSGPTPFTYLPFALLWYLPAQLLLVDLRFFEMLVSSLVPVAYYLTGKVINTLYHVPIVAVISLTPFLLDLSADGSNDNSAILLLLLSTVLFLSSGVRKNVLAAILSAIVLGLAATFKHYVWFYLIFFLPFLWYTRGSLPISNRRYITIFLITAVLLCLPFIVSSPSGFWRSLFFIEIGNFHTTWGWNIWVALRDQLGIIVSKEQMWMVRTIGTTCTVIGLWRFFRLSSLPRVAMATSVTLFVYLVLSNWTTYAYFTFLVPLLGISALPEIRKKQ